MSLALASRRAAISPAWVKNPLWRTARAVPSLDQPFADTKSLVDAVTGQSLVTFTRASSGTCVGSDGLIKTAAVNEPRFDHNPTTGESLGLLVEEQRTNEVRNSNSMSAVVTGSPGTLPTNWSAQGNANGWTREIVGSGSLGSLNYVDIRFYGTPTSTQFSMVFQPQGTVSAANGQAWAASVYHQLVGGSLGNVVGYPAANLWNSTLAYLGGLGLPGSIVPSATLQRYTGSATISTAGTAFINWGITFVCTAGNTYDFTIRFAGPQLELGAFSTSFIPTTGAAATRSADVASITGTAFSSWYRQDEGTVYGDFIRTASTNSQQGRVFSFSDGTNTNQLEIYQTGGSNPSAQITVTTLQAQWITSNFTVGASTREALGYQLNNANASFNGSAEATDTVCIMPTALTQARIGDRQDGVRTLNGTIRRLTYWPQRLPNSTLQAITQ